jgi:hypothetical protein
MANSFYSPFKGEMMENPLQSYTWFRVHNSRLAVCQLKCVPSSSSVVVVIVIVVVVVIVVIVVVIVVVIIVVDDGDYNRDEGFDES